MQLLAVYYFGILNNAKAPACHLFYGNFPDKIKKNIQSNSAQ
jgi:hypothetical protein